MVTEIDQLKNSVEDLKQLLEFETQNSGRKQDRLEQILIS